MPLIKPKLKYQSSGKRNIVPQIIPQGLYFDVQIVVMRKVNLQFYLSSATNHIVNVFDQRVIESFCSDSPKIFSSVADVKEFYVLKISAVFVIKRSKVKFHVNFVEDCVSNVWTVVANVILGEVIVFADKLFETGNEISKRRSLEVSVFLGLWQLFVRFLEQGAVCFVCSESPIFRANVHENGHYVMAVWKCKFTVKLNIWV